MSSLLFGLIFFLAGLVSGLLPIYIAITEGEFILAVVGLMFLCSFCGVGISLIHPYIKDFILSSKLKTNGTIYQARIVDYRDGVIVNNVPELSVVCEFTKDGEPRRVVINTHQFSEKEYPLGAYCDIKVLGIDALIVKGSVKI